MKRSGVSTNPTKFSKMAANMPIFLLFSTVNSSCSMESSSTYWNISPKICAQQPHGVVSLTVFRMTVSAVSNPAGAKESMVAVSLQRFVAYTLQPMHISIELSRIIRQ